MSACSIKVRGIVQGVGFRPFVFRLAQENTLAGWVLNNEDGVDIFLEGADQGLEAFVRGLKNTPPPAARIAGIEIENSEPVGLEDFEIRESSCHHRPTAGISPDLPVCEECLQELFDPVDARYKYPYINCTNCGPRYTVALRLPYDRQNTTMKPWALDDFCEQQYEDPRNRRFHAQPLACPSCGPSYYLQSSDGIVSGSDSSICDASALLATGKIVAIKGLGGYHLACDAINAAAVRELRERKYRKEKPFAVMVRNVVTARAIVELSPKAEALLTSLARPIVLAPAKVELAGIAPDSKELGVMLPYTPLHHLLFDSGAPDILVMTSANRSSEPIAYDDSEAFETLHSIADVFLIGERPIARRVDDSVARDGAFGPAILRRSRGYAPSAVATIPTRRPILALGADLKNTITLVIGGYAFVSQHIGDLSDCQSFHSFEQTISDFLSMYEVDRNDLLVVHDRHPQYASTSHAESLAAVERVSAQHHRAHIASVLAEHGAWDKRVIGVSSDGAGYGDDGTIWGGEMFIGTMRQGFKRVAHLRPAALPGGDAAAHCPVQAAAGFLAQVEDLPDLGSVPFSFPSRFGKAQTLMKKGLRTFTTTSMGRLFDTAAALLGFTRMSSFEGQAAMWLEQLARGAQTVDSYAFPFRERELDFRPLLHDVAHERAKGRSVPQVARAFQRSVAHGLAQAIAELCEAHRIDTVVLSGGVFQNELLMEDLRDLTAGKSLSVWTNREVPTNDGGISLGQAALAAFGQCQPETTESHHA